MLRSKPLTGLLNIFLCAFSLSLNYLHANAYGFLHPESIAFLTTFVTLLLLLFFFLHLLKADWLFYAILLGLIIDLTLGAASVLYKSLHLLFRFEYTLWIIVYASLSAMLSFAAFGLRRHIHKICFAIFLTIFATTVPFFIFQRPSLYKTQVFNTAQEAASPKPNILFMILDEHIGVEGIPISVEGGLALKGELTERYSRNGFRIYEKAFSNYFWTLASLSSMFNAEIYRSGRVTEIRRNRILNKLQQEGYRINVYQSSHADFCNPDAVRCNKLFTYHENSLGYLLYVKSATKDRFRFLLDGFVLSYRSKGLEWFRNKLFGDPDDRKFGVLATDRVLKELRTDLKNSPSGHVFLVHLLMPHYSYLNDSNCNFSIGDSAAPNDELETIRKHHLYFDQVRCLEKKLSDLFQDLRDSGMYPSMTIFLMGDHGSRITERKTADQANLADYLELFSTFLAVKPGDYSHDLIEKSGNGPDAKIPVAKVLWNYFGISPNPSVERDFYEVYFRVSNSYIARKMPDFPIYQNGIKRMDANLK